MDLTSYSLLVLAAFIGLCGKGCHGSITDCPSDIVPSCPTWPVNCTDDMPTGFRFARVYGAGVTAGTICKGCPVCLPNDCPAVPYNGVQLPPGCNTTTVKFYTFYTIINEEDCFAGESFQCI